jgi:hypothetical protein
MLRDPPFRLFSRNLLRTSLLKSSKLASYLISSFRPAVNVVFFLLGDSSASEFYVPTFRNILSVPCVLFFILVDSTASEFYVPTFRNIMSGPCVLFFLLGDSTQQHRLPFGCEPREQLQLSPPKCLDNGERPCLQLAKNSDQPADKRGSHEVVYGN